MKKRSITLLEVMIVILLIGLIGGVVSYNLKGTLDKGKAFRSKEGAQKLQDILNLELQTSSKQAEDFASGPNKDQTNVIECVKQSGLVSHPKSFVKDGWNEPYKIAARENNTVEVWSTRLNEYNKEHGKQEQEE